MEQQVKVDPVSFAKRPESIGDQAVSAPQTGADYLADSFLFELARALEPEKGSIREALARAYFRSGRFAAAEDEFRAALDIEPVNDYAHFGVGLCRLRAGDQRGARGHLRQATVMRPDNADYRAALYRAEPAEVDGEDRD